MRLRYRSVTYAVGGTASSLERHYRELREAMLRGGQHYGFQPDTPWRPPIDISETPQALSIKMELAGIREDSLDITLYENALVVTGQREDDTPQGESVYYHEAQVRYGPFRADILLSAAIEREAVEATYENGFLRVRLPKAVGVAGASPGPAEHEREEVSSEHGGGRTTNTFQAAAQPMPIVLRTRGAAPATPGNPCESAR